MWYVARPGQRRGPLSETEFRDLVERGEVVATDLLWRPGFSGWLAAEQVPGVLAPPEPSFPSSTTSGAPTQETSTDRGKESQSYNPPSPVAKYDGDAHDASDELPSLKINESESEAPSAHSPSGPLSDTTAISIDYFHQAAGVDIAAKRGDRLSAYINAISRRPSDVPYTAEHRELLATFLADRSPTDSDVPMSMREILERLPSTSPEQLHDFPQARLHTHRKPARFFITKFWRGEYSLAASYWGVGVLVAPITGAVVRVVSARDPAVVTHPNRLVFGMLGTWLLAFTITIWQSVGVWRSALNHMAQTGRKFWALLAMVAVFLGLFRSAGIAVDQAIPQCAALIRIAMGHDFGPFVIREQPGDQIEVAGPLSFGVSEKLAEALSAHPSTKSIRLNSPGGRVGEGTAIRELVRRRHLDTITTEGCESACVLAFSGGTKRILKFGAHLGFHRPAFPGLTDTVISEEVGDEVRLLVKSGMDEAFIKNALSTPNDRMLRPTAAELLAANVITEILAPQRDDMERLVGHVDPMPVLKKYLPGEYNKFLDEFALMLGKSDSAPMETLLNELAARASATIGAAMTRNLSRASDEAVRSFARAKVRDIRELMERDPVACLAFLEGRVNGSLRFSEGAQRENNLAIAEVLRTGYEKPERTPSRGEVNGDLATVHSALRRRFGSAVSLLDGRPRTEAEQRQKCLLEAAFLEEVLALSPASSGRLFRFLSSLP